METVSTVGVVPDVHGFHMDPIAASAVLRGFSAAKVGRIVLIGDLVDAPTISKYPKDPRVTKVGRIALERAALKPLMKAVEAFNVPVDVTLGNHDARLADYIVMHAPELADAFDDLPSDPLKFENVYGLPKRWKVHPHESIFRHNGVAFTHGTSFYSKDSGVGALKGARENGMPFVIGHSHRLALGHRTTVNGVMPFAEVGHISKPPHYTSKTLDSQQGFALVHFDGGVNVELVRIDNGRAFFRGRWL